MTTARLVSLGEVVKSADPGFACGEHLPTGVVQLRMNNVTVVGTLDWSAMRRVPSNDTKSRKYRLAPGDVVFNHTNSPELVGKTALFTGFKEAVVYSNHFLRLRIDGANLDPRYLALWLNSQWKNRVFQRLCTQWVNQATVRRDDLLDLEIALPDLAEQKRIAAILERTDRLRRLRRYGLEMGESLLPAAFKRFVGCSGQSNNSWPVHELEDLCADIIDCPHSTPIYSARPTPHPCVRSSDIQKGFLDFAEAKYVDGDEYKARIARGAPLPGDVIYCREGARFGNAARVVDSAKVCLGQRMMLFRVNKKIATSEFVWAFLSSEAGYRQATRALDGSASPHVNIREIVAFPVPVPPLAVQEHFVRIVRQYDRIRAIHREALRQAEHLFQTLLDRAFTSGI
jgi:type I restriction enzyme S subunit